MALSALSNYASSGPAAHAFAITPSDTTVFANATREIWVGGTGTMTVLMNGDTVPVLISAIPAGTMLNISATKVMATGTSATLIVGFY